ncbi:MAG TPA: peptidylprolyl isomerase [Terracidiphilus sp.]|nr:peptidylprolyl isomerase [Terracidiphilus sp.]
MTPISLRIPAAFVFGTALLASSALSQTRPATPQSPYGGVTVEDIVTRVNDQIITQSDYDRAMKELDGEAKQRGATMQQISEAHKDLLRDLIDRQLWLSKGKDLGINGETELIKRLDEIRKQYNLETLEDLEKAAKEQGVSFEDFKANIRNGIITQEVMRQEVGRRVQFTQGEVQRYFEQHKQEYAKPESVDLSEILVSTGADPDDAAKVAAGKAKADDIEAKLHAGGDFSQLAKSFSDGTTASEGGAFGTFHKGELAKVFEDATFALKSGQYTDPIRTKQGYIIFKVDQHVPGGVPAFKDVEQDVEQSFYESRMAPAMRDYLTQMREEAYIDIKPGYADSGASTKEIKPVYSAYTPPAPKKKKKVERTRFRETTRTFRQKSPQAALPTEAAPPAPAPKTAATKKNTSLKTEKPGKKEKIRFGKAPTKTLPTAASSNTEDAGAVAPVAAAAPEPVNPLEASKPTQKSRFSARAKTEKKNKVKGPSLDSDAPLPPDAAEVADRQSQAAPLGLSGDTTASKKKKKTTTGDKTRLTDKNKKPEATAPDSNATPSAPAPQTPPPAPAPAPQP